LPVREDDLTDYWTKTWNTPDPVQPLQLISKGFTRNLSPPAPGGQRYSSKIQLFGVYRGAIERRSAISDQPEERFTFLVSRWKTATSAKRHGRLGPWPRFTGPLVVDPELNAENARGERRARETAPETPLRLIADS
jgi:hypothetical protein